MTRAQAARALGQRTTSANARGFYITEALQNEGELKFKGKPVTLDALRTVLGTPAKEQLEKAPVSSVLEYLRYFVDLVKVGDRRIAFTLSVEGDSEVHGVLLRNGVLVISPAERPGVTHVTTSRAQLAGFVLGESDLAGLGNVIDRSQFMARPEPAAELGTHTINIE